MPLTDPDLWQQLGSYELDNESPFPFSHRLARENGWSLTFADRVIDEYRRFIYLAATATTPMTPSDEVDQVWHLHLAYSRDYWIRLCGDVLGKTLHHGPTRGGDDEASKYARCYAETKHRYRQEFDETPPIDIWPSTEDRFNAAATYRRVKASDYWMVPIPRVSVSARRAGAVVLGACMTTLTACSVIDANRENILEALGSDAFTALVFIFIAGFAAVRVGWDKLIRYIIGDETPPDRNKDGSGCVHGSGGCAGCGGCGS